MSNSSSSGPSFAGDSVRTIEERLAALRAERLRIDTECKEANDDREALERAFKDASRKSVRLQYALSALDKELHHAQVALKDATFSSEAETIDKPTLIKMFDTVKTFPQFLKCYELLTAKHGVTDPNCVLTYGSLFFTILHHCEDLQERLKILSYLVEKGADPMLVPDGAEWSRHFANVWNSCPRPFEKKTLTPFLRLIYATFHRALVRFKAERNLDEVSAFVSVVTLEVLKQAEICDKAFYMCSEWRTPSQIETRHMFRHMYDQLLVAFREHPLTIFEDTIRDLTGPTWNTWKHETLKLPSSST